MKKERLQQTMHKYKGLSETIMNNYTSMKWITSKKWTDSQKSSIFQLNQEGLEVMNNPITSTEIEGVIKNLPKTKSPGLYGFTGKFYQTFREELMSIPLKHFQKIAGEGTLPNSFYEATITLIPKPKITQKKKTTGQYH